MREDCMQEGAAVEEPGSVHDIPSQILGTSCVFKSLNWNFFSSFILHVRAAPLSYISIEISSVFYISQTNSAWQVYIELLYCVVLYCIVSYDM